MLGPITRTYARHGYDLLISSQQPEENWHVAYEDSRKADGIILLGYGDYGIQIAFALQAANVSRMFQSLGARVEDLSIL